MGVAIADPNSALLLRLPTCLDVSSSACKVLIPPPNSLITTSPICCSLQHEQKPTDVLPAAQSARSSSRNRSQLRQSSHKSSNRKFPPSSGKNTEVTNHEEAAVALQHVHVGNPLNSSDILPARDSVVEDVRADRECDANNPSLTSSNCRSEVCSIRIKGERCRRRQSSLTMRLQKIESIDLKPEFCNLVADGNFGNESSIIWSVTVDQLVRQYGDSFNPMAQKWQNLGNELLTAEEERWLAFLMKPFKVRSDATR